MSLDVITIIEDRYNGVYSGAKYTAWNLTYDEIPDGVESGDGECVVFWHEYKGIVGKGNSPKEALEDLIIQD